MGIPGLAGLRVVVTRAGKSSAAIADHLRQLGADPVVCPAIEIQFRNPPGLDNALGAIERFDWVVFTSANAVSAVLARCRELGIEPHAALGRVRVAAVGQATAASLEQQEVAVDVVPAEQTGAGLARELVQRGIEGQLVLFPASRIARPELPAALRAAGAGVVQLGVYETVAPAGLPDQCREALERGDVDVLTFASPSAVRNFARLAGERIVRDVPAVCIGETTAGALRAFGAGDPIVAAEPSTGGMAEALLKFQQRASRAR